MGDFIVALGSNTEFEMSTILWAEPSTQARFEVDLEGRVRSASVTAHELLADGAAKLASGRLRFGCDASDKALDDALRRVGRSTTARERIILRRMDGVWAAADLYRAPDPEAALLVMYEAADVSPAAMAALADAFDLTRSETLVLHALSDGACPKQIARELDLSEHTVRSHLRSIYSKLGVRGLPNVLRLVTRLLV